MNLPAYCFLAVVSCIPLQASAQLLDVWIGTGRANNSKGIYHATLNSETGKLSETTLVAEMSGPGFLAMHPNKSHLYAVGSLDGEPTVAAFAIRQHLARRMNANMSRAAVTDFDGIDEGQ